MNLALRSMSCMFLALCAALSACSGEAQGPSSQPAQDANEQRPILAEATPEQFRGSYVSATMRAELRRLSELMAPAEYERFEAKQAQWLRQREEHCAASAEIAKGTTETETVILECRRNTDDQHMERLRDRHFRLLAAAPGPSREPEPRQIGVDQTRPTTAVQSMLLLEHTGQLVIGGGTKIHSFDVKSGARSWSREAADRSTTRLAVSPNGRILVSGSRDDMLLRFWDAESGDFLTEINVKQKGAPFAFLRDGTHLVIGGSRLLLLDFDSRRLAQVPVSTGNTSSIAVSQEHVVVGKKGGEIVTYTIRQRTDAVELDMESRATATVPRSPVVALALSDDGAQLTSVTRSGVIGTWFMPDLGRITGAHSELGYVGSAAITRDQQILFLSGNTATTRGTRGRVLAVDVEGGHTKRLYEEARTNAPAIVLSEPSETLIIGDSTLLNALPVATSPLAFDAMPSIADGSLAGVSTPEETLAERRGRTGSRPKSVLGELSDDTRVHVVGVYEGELPDGERRGFRQHKQGQVTVNVGGSGRAVLVLTAYEPVKWTVRPQGVFVDHILLYGYHDQEVDAPAGSRVYSNLQAAASSSRIYAYKKDGNYEKLAQAVREITGKDVDTFQGKYRAGHFSVNARGSAGSDPDKIPGINKWVDEDGVVHYGDTRTGSGGN